jgi:DNA gyrase/topoisomerase IV subunit A
MTDATDTLLNITKRCLKAYGQEVVEERAVPDYRDGLKPVHRFILWSCYRLGLVHGTPFKKSARTVGDVLGKYHPHGDQSCYQAMVGLAGTKSDDTKTWVTKNSCVPLIEGYGNWGDNLDNAASMRYTEARLSEFSTKYLLDPVYLAVTDMVPNFSGDDQVPLVLPAKLPVVLLNGSVSIAFGVSAECPAFEPEGVISLVAKCLEGVAITPKLLTTELVFTSAFGGVCISDKKEVYEFHKTGTGSLKFSPEVEMDEKKRLITLRSSCPGLSSKTSWATLAERLSQLKEVQSVADASDRHGFKFEIVSERGVEFNTFLDIVEASVTKKYSYSIGITKREKTGIAFARTNVGTIIKDWCTWRVALETKVIKHLISVESHKLSRVILLILAVDNLKVIMASLSKEDSAGYISQHLKITVAEANTILDLKVRQLKSLEKTKLLSQKKSIELELKTLHTDLKQPTKRVLKDLLSIQL